MTPFFEFGIISTVEINDGTTNGPVLYNKDKFGRSVANIGDLNNDGVSDIAVGTSQDDNGGNDRGAIHTLFLEEFVEKEDNLTLHGSLDISNSGIPGNRESFTIRHGGGFTNSTIFEGGYFAQRDGNAPFAALSGLDDPSNIPGSPARILGVGGT